MQQPAPATAAGLAAEIAARWSASDAPPFTRDLPIEFRTLDYTATVFYPGSPKGFTAFITTRRTTLVTTASAATIVASNGASARFATPVDQAMWQAAGRPSLGQAPPTVVKQTIPAGQYTFIPQGRYLTYQLAAGLSAERDSLAAVLAGYLGGYAGAHPPASQELREVAHLIAKAPLTDAVRAAAWRVMASLPGLSICQDLPGQADPDAIGLCIDSAGDQTVVNVDPNTGAIVTIADRLTQTSPDYPHVAAGTIVGLSTFLSG
ncbi:MAG TPA: hypothetical protein VJT31_17120 [Rugosimonospora sp.]|nr:hypothetical protein [Rugosimonospora sp.]